MSERPQSSALPLTTGVNGIVIILRRVVYYRAGLIIRHRPGDSAAGQTNRRSHCQKKEQVFHFHNLNSELSGFSAPDD